MAGGDIIWLKHQVQDDEGVERIMMEEIGKTLVLIKITIKDRII
jgi:hypothetical protein